MEVESSICLSDLVPALRWSRPQHVADALGDPRLPAGWWSSLALSKAVGAAGLDWLCDRLAHLAFSQWDHLPLCDLLPALTVHHIDPALPGWPDSTRTAVTGLGGWQRLRRLCPGDLTTPSATPEVVMGAVFREVLGRIPAQREAPASELPAAAAAPSSTPSGTASPTPGSASPLPAGQRSQAPGPQAPAVPGSQVPAAPGPQVPAGPGSQVPGALGSQIPATPGNQVPAAPGRPVTAAQVPPVPAAPAPAVPAPAAAQASEAGRPAEQNGVAGDGVPRGTGPFPAAAPEPRPQPPVGTESGWFAAQSGPSARPDQGESQRPAFPQEGQPRQQGAFPPGQNPRQTGSFPAVNGQQRHTGSFPAVDQPRQTGSFPAVDGQPRQTGSFPAVDGQQRHTGSFPAVDQPRQTGSFPAQAPGGSLPQRPVPGQSGQPERLPQRPTGQQPGRQDAGSDGPSTGNIPRVPSGGPGTGNIPRIPSGGPGTGNIPRVPSGGPSTGSIPAVPSETDHAMVRVVDGLFRSLDKLELAVAVHRLFAEDPISLRTLAHKLLVERDALSQAQRTAEERVLHWLRSSESAPVTGHMFRLTEWLGAAATEEQLVGADPAHPVMVPTLRTPLWRVLVTLMPDRRLQDGWLVVGDLHSLQARTRQVIASAPADADMVELMAELGIRAHSAKAWLEALPPESAAPERVAAQTAAAQQPLPRRTPGANGHHHRGGQPIPPAPAGSIDPSAALAALSALSGGRSPMLNGGLAGTPSTPPPPPPSPSSDPRRWQRIEVTPEHLRGGPVPVPEGYAAQLGMRPGTLLSVTGPGDNAIVLVWQGHQPVFDSLQPVLMRLNARPGDQVYVTVDGYRLEAQLTG
ncbi:hypothetical protein [Nonomuraea maritima]|nr:hypothetical protein [Nonomuraea maritima]